MIKINPKKIFSAILLRDLKKLPINIDNWLTDYIDQDTNYVTISYLKTEIKIRKDSNKELKTEFPAPQEEIDENTELIQQITELINVMLENNINRIILNENI